MKRGLRGLSPVRVVGLVTMAVGLLLFVVAGAIANTISNPGNVTGQTSTRWNHRDTVSGFLGVTLLVFGSVIAHVGRRPQPDR